MANLNQPAPLKSAMFLPNGSIAPVWAKWFENIRATANSKQDTQGNGVEDNIVTLDENGALQDSGVDIASIIVLNTVEISADYTVLDDDDYLHLQVTTGASDVTITLPTLADNVDRAFYVTKVDSGAGEVIIAGEGSETITGEASRTIKFQYTTAQITDGANEWLLI